MVLDRRLMAVGVGVVVGLRRGMYHIAYCIIDVDVEVDVDGCRSLVLSCMHAWRSIKRCVCDGLAVPGHSGVVALVG
jgi:hypothetical protein